MTLDKKFWENKKVLVTGHTGFKGSWLSCLLKYLNCEVTGLSDNKILSDNYKTLNTSEIFSCEKTLDIYRDIDEVKKVMNSEFDIVFHLAAQGIVSTASKYPLETIKTNVIGTYNILEAANNNEKINTVIVSTTDKVYLHTSKDNIETDQLGGKEFYSASKASAEHVIAAFVNTRKRKNLNIGVVRSGNVLGGGDGAEDRIVTDVISSLKNNADIYLRNPNSIRPWQFIMDSLLGYLLAAQYCNLTNVDEIFNLNSKLNNDRTVKDLAVLIKNKWNSTSTQIKTAQSNFYETEVLKIDSDKANEVLNWSAKEDLDSIASYIVNWEKEILNSDNKTFEQIDLYFKK